MNFFRKWKNRETKKRLKEENVRLKREIDFMRTISQSNIVIVDKKVKTLRVQEILSDFMEEIPVDIIKKRMICNLAEHLESFVEWKLEDDYGGTENKVLTGTLYVISK